MSKKMEEAVKRLIFVSIVVLLIFVVLLGISGIMVEVGVHNYNEFGERFGIIARQEGEIMGGPDSQSTIERLHDGNGKIRLDDEEVSEVNINVIDNVIIDLNDSLYEVVFMIMEQGVILKVANGEFLIEEKEFLPVLMGEQGMYVGAARIEATSAVMVLGLNKTKVQERIGLAEMDVKEEGGNGVKLNGLGWYYLIVVVIIGIIFIIILFLLRVIMKNYKEKKALENFGNIGVLSR